MTEDEPTGTALATARTIDALRGEGLQNDDWVAVLPADGYFAPTKFGLDIAIQRASSSTKNAIFMIAQKATHQEDDYAYITGHANNVMSWRNHIRG